MQGKKSVVVCFSATGRTRAIASRIAKIEGCPMIEITPKEPYTETDLNWHDNTSRVAREIKGFATIRPEIEGKIDVSEYDEIFLGYPIWWGEAPNIIYTFLEGADLRGKAVLPFCKSGGSGSGQSAKNLQRKSSGAAWAPVKEFDTRICEADIKKWKDSLNG